MQDRKGILLRLTAESIQADRHCLDQVSPLYHDFVLRSCLPEVHHEVQELLQVRGLGGSILPTRESVHSPHLTIQRGRVERLFPEAKCDFRCDRLAQEVQDALSVTKIEDQRPIRTETTWSGYSRVRQGRMDADLQQFLARIWGRRDFSS